MGLASWAFLFATTDTYEGLTARRATPRRTRTQTHATRREKGTGTAHAPARTHTRERHVPTEQSPSQLPMSSEEWSWLGLRPSASPTLPRAEPGSAPNPQG